MQNLCRKKRQFVPGYYFANDCNDAVNRIGYIFMIYILYHRLICFSSYNTITYSGRQLSQIIKISFSRSQASSSVIRAHSVHESKVYCFFFQIPLNRLLKRNFFSVESAISWAREESLVGLDLPTYSEKLQRVMALRLISRNNFCYPWKDCDHACWCFSSDYPPAVPVWDSC